MFDGWQLALIDSAGYNGIRQEHIDAVAMEIRKLDTMIISWEDFEYACLQCGINPNNFTQDDLDNLEDTLNQCTY